MFYSFFADKKDILFRLILSGSTCRTNTHDSAQADFPAPNRFAASVRFFLVPLASRLLAAAVPFKFYL